MACPTCDEIDQQIMLVRSKLQHAEDPSIRNALELEEATLERKLNTHQATCADKTG